MWGRRRREGEGGPSDGESYMDLARCIADEERRKHHTAPANELLRRGIRSTWRRRQMGGAFSG